MMRCLRFVSLLVLLASCNSNPYRNIQAHAPSGKSALVYKPTVVRDLYRCVIDGRFLIKKFHLSGILLIKRLENGSLRTVFQNEAGLSFFDFEWSKSDSFRVVSAIPQLNKAAVIKTLKTDFTLLLMNGPSYSTAHEAKLFEGGDTVSRFPINQGHAFYRQAARGISKIDYAGKSLVTTASFAPGTLNGAIPDTVRFVHHKAHFSIVLQKLKQADNE